MVIKVVVFDLGGVVFEDGKTNAIPQLARQYGYDSGVLKELLTSKESNDLRKGLMEEAEFWEFFRRVMLERSQQRLTEEDIRRVKLVWYDGYTPDRDMWALVHELRQNAYATACFTGNIKSRIDHLETKYHFQELFDHKVYSYDFHMSKSQPEFMHALVDVVQCLPNEILFIDDELKHKQVAESVGIQALVYKTHEIGPLRHLMRQLGVKIAA
eukprot:TRINITY_DN5230_c0_g1_i2.p2 TRINITY_DN5230_c0_g1~~TRINITY_DN5230_c0_g1_i2.p2  ORF type:complete len:221 (-),score=60.22 TRINITY_DN5230_c0_g1_i2:983-1621(-)